VVGAGALGLCYLGKFLLTVIKFVVSWMICLLVDSYTYFAMKKRVSVFVPGQNTVDGTLKWDADGPYIECTVAGILTKVKLTATDYSVMSAGVSMFSRRNESMIPGSVVYDGPLPRFQVYFVVKDQIIGSGFRTIVGGKSCLITAKHVIRTLIGTGSTVYVMKNGKTLPMDKSWKVLFSTNADIVGIEFPFNAASLLGVGTAKIGRTPSVGQPVRVYGSMQFIDKFTTGVIDSVGSGFAITHTASTTEGFSGAPLIANSFVVGVHLAGDAGINHGVSFDWFEGMTFESETKQRAFSLQHEPIEGSIAFRYRSGKIATDVMTKGSAYYRDVSTKYEGPDQSWADLYDDDDEMDFGAPVVFESAPLKEDAVLKTQTSASLSGNTTGPAEIFSQPEEPCLVHADVSPAIHQEDSIKREDQTKPKKKRSRKSKNSSGPASTPKPLSKACESTLMDTLVLINQRLSTLETRLTASSIPASTL